MMLNVLLSCWNEWHEMVMCDVEIGWVLVVENCCIFLGTKGISRLTSEDFAL